MPSELGKWGVSGLVDKGVEFRGYSFDRKQTSGGLKPGSDVMGFLLR